MCGAGLGAVRIEALEGIGRVVPPATRNTGCRGCWSVGGRLERSPEGVLNLVADRLQKLALTVPVKSRDFR